MWLTENPWPVVFIVAAVASFFLIRALTTGLARNWMLMVGCIILGGVLFYVEAVIVTPAEEVELEVQSLLDVCKTDDVPAVLDYFSNTNLILKTSIAAGMGMADLQDSVQLSDMQVKMVADDSRAISHFRANGGVAVPSLSYEGRVASRWEVTWQKEGERWKIVDVKRLNPITGDEMGLLDRSET